MERQHGVFKCSRALFPTYSFGFLLSWQAPATAVCRFRLPFQPAFSDDSPLGYWVA